MGLFFACCIFRWDKAHVLFSVNCIPDQIITYQLWIIRAAVNTEKSLCAIAFSTLLDPLFKSVLRWGVGSTNSGARDDRIYGLISFTRLGLTDFTSLGLAEFYNKNIFIGVLISYWAHCSTWRGNVPHKKKFCLKETKVMKSYWNILKCMFKQKCNIEQHNALSWLWWGCVWLSKDLCQ